MADDPARQAPASRGLLDGLRVVDLTDMRGALCARILADLGAEVIRIQRPGDASTDTFEHRFRNANKRGVRLDPATAEGRAAFDALLAQADVLIDNVDLGDRARDGVDPDDVAQRHPHLVHVALTDMGLTGPRASWRLEALPALAASGALHASGFPDMPPCTAPGHLAHDCAAVHGALGAVAAVMDRERTGRGQLVEVSAQEAALAGTTPWSVALADYTHINPFLPVEGKRNADGSYWVLPAADGWVRTVIGSKRQWDGFVKLLRSPDALTGPEWDQPGFRLMNADVVRLVAQECLVDRTRAQLFDEALALGATVGVLQTPLEFVAHPQTRARKYFLDTGLPGIEGLPFAPLPVRGTRFEPTVRVPAPVAGDETASTTATFSSSSARQIPSGAAASAAAQDDVGRLLLEGVRVVEFGVAAVVPELCWMLSELGADVIKIESLAHPDVLRQTGGDRINCGFAFNSECRGRRSVALDLGTEEGRRLAFELCAGADVVAENHRGGVLEKLGLGYEALRERNPGLIYVSSQGYGLGGPFGEMPAYGPLNAGFAGVHLLWNHPDAPYPCGTSLNHPDHIAGKLLAVAVLAALAERERSGEGQRLEMAQTEAAAFFIGEVYLEAAHRGVDPEPRGNRDDRFVPHGVYRAAGDDEWIAIAVRDDAAWQRLVTAVGWEHEAKLDTLEARLAARDEIDARLEAWTSTRPADDAASLLQSAGVSAMPVMGPVAQRADEHLNARGYLTLLQHPEVGPEHHVGNPVRFSRMAQRTASSAPCLGADTEEVLTEVLGLSPGEVEQLVARGVCR